MKLSMFVSAATPFYPFAGNIKVQRADLNNRTAELLKNQGEALPLSQVLTNSIVPPASVSEAHQVNT
jgi:hypothetical protein